MSNSLGTPFAAYFGGQSYLQNLGPKDRGGGLDGCIAQDTSAFGLLSFWYWTYVMPAKGYRRTVFLMKPATGKSGGTLLVWFYRGSGEEQPRIYILVQTGSNTWVIFRTDFVPFADSQWHHLLFAWRTDVSPNQLDSCYLDNEQLANSVYQHVGSATFTTQYRQSQWFFVAGDPGLLNANFTGALADVFFDPLPTGLTVGGVGVGDALVKSYYSTLYKHRIIAPGHIGADGVSILRRKPAIYLHGLGPRFYFNHGGDSSFKSFGTISSTAPEVADPFWVRLLKGAVGAVGYSLTKTPTIYISPYPNGGIRGSLFDVPTLMQASATTVKPTVADSPTGIISLWVQKNVTNYMYYDTFLIGTVGPNIIDGSSVGLTKSISWSINADQLSLILCNLDSPAFNGVDGNATGWVHFISDQRWPRDNNWHHVIVAWDTRTPACKIYVDGVQWTTTTRSLHGATTNFAAVKYTASNYSFQFGAQLLNDEFTADAFVGQMAEVYVNLTNFNFLSALPSLIGQFRDNQGYARELGTMASLPLGPSNRPDFFLSGGPDEFVCSFAKSDGIIGHRWGVDGGDVDSTFRFTVSGGPLKQGKSDPFPSDELVS